MKIALEIHSIDWENKSTSFLDLVTFEGEPIDILYNLSGFLANGDGEYQMIIKSAKVA